MLAGYESHQWFEFGVAIVGAAAVLSGLLFVAMSINIERIMAIVTLPARAAGTLVLFVIPLMVGTWMLIPEQSTTLLGAEQRSQVGRRLSRGENRARYSVLPMAAEPRGERRQVN